MSRKKVRNLNPEEKVLWQQVKRTVSPISHHSSQLEEWLEYGETGMKPDPSGDADVHSSTKITVGKNPNTRPPAQPFYSPPVSTKSASRPINGIIDDNTARKLSKGRLPIEGRIDLHGMTQQQAHYQLLYFLQHCQETGKRIVLVITGKGRQNDGVLRTLVPSWFSEPLMGTFVSGFRESHISHGGSGALYVRIRRAERTRPK